MREVYKSIMAHLRTARESVGITTEVLADRLGRSHGDVIAAENCEYRLDFVEFYEWLNALEYPLLRFLEEIGWVPVTIVAPDHIYPERGKATEDDGGIILTMKYAGGVSQVLIHGATVESYLGVEKYIVETYHRMNENPKIKNRDAIYVALTYAIENLPDVNPSDIYQHIVYRLYLRESASGNPEQSWRRAGGEAMEKFVENFYRDRFTKEHIQILALISNDDKKLALREMGLGDKIGSAKLDIALYGVHNGRRYIFGGVHCKSSLAERVTDDVPASEAMMRKGLMSVLYTFDSKSFPPPTGDLINRGELGTIENPSDKRKYIEEHGSFDACFSYNTRGTASGETTTSGKKIYVSDLKSENDYFPDFVIQRWNEFKKQLPE